MQDSQLGQLPHIGIGEAAKLYGLTPRAMRFYEERGLVVARRDRLNKRHYDGAARRKLEWIALLRKAGLGLYEIGQVLSADDRAGQTRERAVEQLKARRRAMEMELTIVELALLKLAPTEVGHAREAGSTISRRAG